MNISVKVTGNILEYLESKVKSGVYKNRSEVIREAIRKMIQKDLQEQMKAKGITIESLDDLREEVSGELLDEKYK